MLIEAAGIERIPWIQFGYYSEMYEPVMLEHLMNGFRSICRDLPAYCSHLLKFALP